MSLPAACRRRLADDAAALGPDVVDAFVGLYGGPTAAAEALTITTGRPYRRQEVSDMQAGRRPVPWPAHEAMMVCVLAKLVDDAAPAVARVLALPKRIK